MVPRFSPARATGRKTWAASVLGVGKASTATMNGTLVQRPAGQVAVGEVGERVGAEQDQCLRAGPRRRRRGSRRCRAPARRATPPQAASNQARPASSVTRPGRKPGRQAEVERHRGHCCAAAPRGTGRRARAQRRPQCAAGSATTADRDDDPAGLAPATAAPRSRDDEPAPARRRRRETAAGRRHRRDSAVGRRRADAAGAVDRPSTSAACGRAASARRRRHGGGSLGREASPGTRPVA